MADPASEPSEQHLDSAIADVYGASPEGFVAKRDALAKELREAGRRDDANTVKRLRKPSRTAWSLDVVALNDPASVEDLVGALAAAIEAQSSGGDLRGALDDLRESVRRFSAMAAEMAKAAGQPVDQAGLVPALSAVVADTEAFEALRAGRLAAIPTGGGVDLLTSLPAIVPPSRGTSRASRSTAEPRPRTGTSASDTQATVEAEATGTEGATQAEAVAATRRALLEAETVVRITRERAAEAERALQRAEIAADVADEQLRVAERTAEARRNELEQARQEAEAAKTRQREAEEAATIARADLDNVTSD